MQVEERLIVGKLRGEALPDLGQVRDCYSLRLAVAVEDYVHVLGTFIICGYLNCVTFVLIISDVEHGVFNKSAVLMHYCVPVFLDPVLTCKQPLTRLEYFQMS